MRMKSILAATMRAAGLVFAGPVLANGSDTDVTISVDKRSSHDGDIVIADQYLKAVITNNDTTKFKDGYRSGDNTAPSNSTTSAFVLLLRAMNSRVFSGLEALTVGTAHGFPRTAAANF